MAEIGDTPDPALEDIYSEGVNLKEELERYFRPIEAAWESSSDKSDERVRQLFEALGQNKDDLIVTVRKWIWTVYARIGYRILTDRLFFENARHNIETSIEGQLGLPDGNSRKFSLRLIDRVLQWIVAAGPPLEDKLESTQQQLQSLFRPNTAFILMWMDKNRPELEDVRGVFKTVFKRFGIEAIRADDVEHSDVITGMILKHIRESEFLIADLSGERPNVYYEIGYAHALGKRPILYRKAGTQLHFDLGLHNVPEYKNNSELTELLHRRLEAMTGRTPSSGPNE